MTVRQLIELLQAQPPESQVLIRAYEDYGFPGRIEFCPAAEDAPYGKGWVPREEPEAWVNFVVING